jgi:glycerol-3-phosphate acyltransferase PlsY
MYNADMIYLLPLLGYLSGSLPFSIWITRYAIGVDVRDSGSGHATTTNTLRQAGVKWGVLVFVLDVAKGFLPTLLAIRLGAPDFIIPLTAVSAVIGHCWPVFAQFRGGMGLATLGGGFLAILPKAFLIALALLLALVLILRHSARGTALAGIAIAPLLWWFGIRDNAFWAALGAGIVITVRFASDWNRSYRELWLDRKKS